MIKSKYPIYLASKSPRRKKMLDLMGVKFNVLDIDVNERINISYSPVKNVKQIAKQKSEEALLRIKSGIVITADTIVVLEGKIIGKPKNKHDAKRILKLLSGKYHFVYTGFAIVNKNLGTKIIDYSKTKVFFRKLEEKEINDYVKTGSPLDKAGAYGIQDDYGAVFVEKIEGCYYNVLGFPMSKIYKSLIKII